MSFTPRRLPDGRPCCTIEYALCDDCKDALATTRRESLGLSSLSASSPGYDPRGTPPDGYRTALATKTLELTPDLDPHYAERGTPPDGYAIGLAVRQLEREIAEEAKPHAESVRNITRRVDRLTPPDPYAAGIAKMRGLN